ncbi:hypothetical protein ANO11243_009740 [Dothideomycetidae sp. 11243]|nr:hypothetical protein ANO11243_009740 [fungal sp. No.11243]
MASTRPRQADDIPAAPPAAHDGIGPPANPAAGSSSAASSVATVPATVTADGDHLRRSRRVGTLAPAACAACRRHKLKCTGERPMCGRCAAARRPCIYTTRPGERPSQALKRNHNAWRDLAEAYEELFRVMRALPERQASDIYRRIRAGFDVRTLLDQVKGGDLVLQLAVAPETRFRYELPYHAELPDALRLDNPYLDCLLYEAASVMPLAWAAADSSSPASTANNPEYRSLYLRPFHAAHTIDPRLINARPSLWTTVSTDDGFMRELLADLFLCEYAFTSAF